MLRVIVGPMFSDKTSTLIDALQARSAREAPATAVLPAIDSRSDGWLRGHNGRCWGPALVLPPEPDWSPLLGTRMVQGAFLAVDEVQFFAPSLAAALRHIADLGVDVLAAGLLRDSQGGGWETTSLLLALADDAEFFEATCACGSPATETGRKIPCEQRIAIGGSDQYVPLCRACFLKGCR